MKLKDCKKILKSIYVGNKTQIIWRAKQNVIYFLNETLECSSKCSDTDRGFFETKRVLTMH